jgi:3-oxoacyl-[acyl-carrier protein] reductase
MTAGTLDGRVVVFVVEAAFGEVEERFGAIDVLVNLTRLDSDYVPDALEDLDLADWRHQAADEPTLVLLTSQAAGALFQVRKSGRIVNISSEAAEMAFNGDGVGKIMVQGFTVGFARELGPSGVTVNTVAAGPVEQDGPVPAGALAKQAVKTANTRTDVGKVVAFLASEAAAQITGQILHVNGGFWMRPA